MWHKNSTIDGWILCGSQVIIKRAHRKMMCLRKDEIRMKTKVFIHKFEHRNGDRYEIHPGK